MKFLVRMNGWSRPSRIKTTPKMAKRRLLEVYRKLRPGEPPTVDSAVTHLQNLFFDSRRYDLSRVGRYKYNKKLGIAFRIAGKTIAEPVANPMTGELMAKHRGCAYH